MKERQLAHHAALVEAAIASGHAAKSAVVASWCRSSRFHRLDPAGSRPPLRLTGAELGRARERAAPLLQAARPIMDRLYQAVGAAGCCVLLAAQDGVPVERRGSPADDATFDSWGLWTGAIWSEEHEGTNGIGTCLVERRPLTIDRDQHFFTRNTLLSCTAAPIYDQDAKLAGVLDVSSCRADRTEAFADLITLAVGEAARRIESDMFRAAFPKARIVLVPALDGHGGGLLAVDADDLVIGATRSARAALGVAPDRAFQPIPAADLLGGAGAALEQFSDGERGVLQRALLRAGGNVSAAAKALGVSRATLHRKLKRFGLKPD
ncbi:GAF domain-containing protein [Bradyrhizobium sp. ARR65]|uniref:GAF domain-containing protein n=1 Tax=Bradyrhizobium sp. ARR65 TaxID=1040989 RepID=UPI0004649566|nr:GAF domain-containing protein [Bradyrhizobium sp. ARR65]